MENNIEHVEAPVVEEKLSAREAIEKAVYEGREAQPDTERTALERPTPAPQAINKMAQEADIEPPSELTAEGKKAWLENNAALIKKEWQRVNQPRLQELSRAQTAERKAREEAQRVMQESQTWKQLGDMAKPYIEARGGQGVDPHKAIMEALALVDAFKKEDPASVKAELKRIGIDLDKAPSQSGAIPPELKSEITSLRQTVSSLQQQQQVENLNRLGQTFDSIFTKLTSEKTRTNESVFPDLLDNSEKGIQFARELGSLTQDANFQRGVLRRFPDADMTTVVREAYKYLGGRVAGEPVKVSANNQHIEKARRAAAAAPGRVATRNEGSSVVGKLSAREAFERALAESREN